MKSPVSRAQQHVLLCSHHGKQVKSAFDLYERGYRWTTQPQVYCTFDSGEDRCRGPIHIYVWSDIAEVLIPVHDGLIP